MSSPSSSATTLAERSEAEPLPRKVGELGYIAPPKSPEIPQDGQQDESPTLPATHPADRRDETPSATPSAPPTSAPDASPSVKKSWRQRLSVGGVSLFSIMRILVLLSFIGGTGAAWGITIQIFANNGYKSNNEDTDTQANVSPSTDIGLQSSNPDDPQIPPSFSSLVIVHISFTVVILVQLLFLERLIFHARAERYLYKHGMARGERANAPMGIAPWTRPSLPTYAAALAESGVGTGDVEDNLIAIVPPPAYGNTRGSVLLLAGQLRDSLVRNLNRSSQQSRSLSTPREMEEGRGSRPISYDASEEVDNARRAVELEAALTRLDTQRHNGPNHTT